MLNRPVEIRREGEFLQINWENKSTTQKKFSEVRLSCACAICKESKVPLQPSMPFYPRAIRPSSIELVGNYALHIAWEDGHRSIVALDRLRGASA